MNRMSCIARNGFTASRRALEAPRGDAQGVCPRFGRNGLSEGLCRGFAAGRILGRAGDAEDRDDIVRREDVVQLTEAARP